MVSMNERYLVGLVTGFKNEKELDGCAWTKQLYKRDAQRSAGSL